MPAFWSALEQMPGLNAIPAVWTSLMGPVFEILKALLFRKRPEPARACFCEKCYCAHEVMPRSAEPLVSSSAQPAKPAEPPPDSATSALAPLVAVCRCESGSCPDIPLTPADIEIWELNWSSLGRALCRALGLDPRSAELPLYNTRQIGSWSADAVPVFLTIQTEPEDLRWAIAELVARLQNPFILLAPTATHFNANCCELLTHVKAGFFALDSIVLLTDHATLRPIKPPGKLFAQFNPQPNDSIPEDAARKVMAIVRKLDFGSPPTPLAVFRRYCLECLTLAEIAWEFKCSPPTVSRRLKDIRKATGKTPAELRALSFYFEGEDGRS